MALSKKALQKKREKKNNKRSKSRAIKSNFSDTLINYKSWDVHECWVSNKLWNSGIGNVVIALKNSFGDIAAGVYLVDVHCLGVKNCFIRHVDLTHYKELLKRVEMSEDGLLDAVDVTYANTLIQQAVNYAMQFGLKPHEDFNQDKKLLRYLPTDNDAHQFEFGAKGKPCYVSGPYASASEVKWILGNLEKHAGEGNYTFVVGTEHMQIMSDYAD